MITLNRGSLEDPDNTWPVRQSPALDSPDLYAKDALQYQREDGGIRAVGNQQLDRYHDQKHFSALLTAFTEND